MGNSNSTTKNDSTKEQFNQQKEEPEKVHEKIVLDNKTKETLENINKVMPQQQDTTDIADTIYDITEVKKNSNDQKGGSKKQIPLLGSFKLGSSLSDTSENVIGGFENKTGRKRYTKYDLFKILKNLDLETEIDQIGGDDVKTESSLNDDESMEHIKNIILKELETLKNNKSQQLGGSGCGCSDSNKRKSQKLNSKINFNNVIVDSEENNQHGGTVIIDASSSSSDTSTSSNSSSSSEYGKSKSKSKTKSKSKHVKRQESSDESSKFVIETSESGKEKESESESESEPDSDTVKQTSNGEEREEKEESEEGLSIFPFNSSDVKSSLSIKNYRMLRRKI